VFSSASAMITVSFVLILLVSVVAFDGAENS
jgi:hypothetical protein